MDYRTCREGLIAYSFDGFIDAKRFVLRKWCELAAESGLPNPQDLSGACKYGSLFMFQIFGGYIRGHYQHHYNQIDGRIVDLSHDSLDVAAMRTPYLHEPDYFDIPEQQAKLEACRERVENWVKEFLAEQEITGTSVHSIEQRTASPSTYIVAARQERGVVE